MLSSRGKLRTYGFGLVWGVSRIECRPTGFDNSNRGWVPKRPRVFYRRKVRRGSSRGGGGTPRTAIGVVVGTVGAAGSPGKHREGPGSPRSARKFQKAPGSPGKLRKPKEALGSPGKPQGAPGSPRKPRGAPGSLRSPREPQEAPGGPGKPQEAPGSIGKPREASGNSGQPRESPGSPGKPREAPGSTGKPVLVEFGSFWFIFGSPGADFPLNAWFRLPGADFPLNARFRVRGSIVSIESSQARSIVDGLASVCLCRQPSAGASRND